MRRFFLALRVGVQVVARPLPHVIQPVQRPPQGVIGKPLSRANLQRLLQQGDRPAHVRPAEFLGRVGEEVLQQMRLVFVQQGATSPTFLVLKGGGIEILPVGLDPVIDGLPRHAQHAGQVGSGAAVVEFQNGKGAPEETSISGVGKLTPEALPLPGSQVEPAHRLLLSCSSITEDHYKQNAVSN